MIHAFATTTPRAGFGLARAVRQLPYAAFTLVVAAVAVCGLAIADMPSRWLAVPVDATAAAPPPAVEKVAAEPVRARCVGCGVVESIRPLAPTGSLPAAFEFTVRMRDGSARVSRTSGRGTWRTGDRIILMAGSGGARE